MLGKLANFAVLLVVAGLAGCSATLQIETCPAPLQPTTTANLYFGRSIDGGGEVSDSDWQRFVDQEVSPRFSSGFTVEDGAGQWLGASGPVREKSKHLQIVLSGRPDDADKLTAIRAAYQTRFHQEAVGLVQTPGCGSFAPVRGGIPAGR
jgi:hypothetical protein